MNFEDQLFDGLIALGREGVLLFMRDKFHALVTANTEVEQPLTGAAYAQLSEADVLSVERAVAATLGEAVLQNLQSWKSRSIEHYKREILRYGCTVAPSLLQAKTRMSAANPPAEIHSMQRQDLFAGDLYSGDMCIAALNRAGKPVTKAGNYLDFGCSSGALVRNMWARYPESNWYGCDPVLSSTEWATANFSAIQFTNNGQSPPLPYATGFMDGAYAISIWSHFSERAAMAWFDELHRILRQGGFLMFTSHGIRSLYYYLDANLMPLKVICRMLAEVMFKKFVLQDVWEDRSEAADGLETLDWGNSYFSPEWVITHLRENWRILDFEPGLNQSNQDVYVLEAR